MTPAAPSAGTTPVPTTPGPDINPWRTLVIIALGAMMVAIDATIVSIANPSITATLGATLGELQWVTHAYLLSLAASLIAAGKLGDRLGHRRLFLVGIVGFVAASVAAGLSRDVAPLIAFRGVQGVFGAALMPSGMGMLRLAFPPEQLSRALGTFSGIIGGAVAAGPVVGGALVAAAGWPAVFFVNLPVGLLALGLGLWLLPANRAMDPDRPIDLIGVALLVPATSALILGLVLAPQRGWTSPLTLVLLLGAAAALALFVLRQARARSPLIPLSLFRSRSFSIGAVVILFMATTMFGSMFFLMLYLQNVRGLAPLAAGLQMLPFSLVLAIGPPIAGRLIGRFGLRAVLPVGLGLAASAQFGLSTVDIATGTPVLSALLGLLGVGIAVIMVGAMSAIVGGAPRHLAGVAGAIQQTLMQLGGSVGTAVFGAVVSVRVGASLDRRLAAAGAPASVDPAAAQSVVAQGGSVIPPGAGPDVAAAITAASDAAFIDGMSLAFSTAGVALAGVTILSMFVTGRSRPGRTARAEADRGGASHLESTSHSRR